MAVLVRQTPGFRLTGLSCGAFYKNYGIILAIELDFMPFMLAGPYFGSAGPVLFSMLLRPIYAESPVDFCNFGTLLGPKN